jgi:hypothetical protein
MKRPPDGDGPFQRGERLTAAKLNAAVTHNPMATAGNAFVMGGAVGADESEGIYIKLTASNGTTPRKYSWQEVFRTANGTWQNGTRTGNYTSDYAIEVNNSTVSTSDGLIYRAERSIDSAEWMFAQGGGGGNVTVNITSGETVLMILGTYEEYANCPGVPPRPPTTYANLPCDETRTTTLCVPAYAYAVYNRCGYVWNKVGDTRDFQVWANELNGGSTTAWRRFVIPRWGGSINPETGLPDPIDDCIGVAFVGAGGSALTCACPTWAQSGQCVKATFRTIPRPFPEGNGGYTDCSSVFTFFDTGDGEGPYWDREFTALINLSGSLCNDSSNGDGPLTFNIVYEDTSRSRCYWGPDVFDPCDPCVGFGRFYVNADINSDLPQPNCGGAGHFSGYLTETDLRSIICDCAELSLREVTLCEACDGGETLPPLTFIDMETLVFTCCPP